MTDHKKILESYTEALRPRKMTWVKKKEYLASLKRTNDGAAEHEDILRQSELFKQIAGDHDQGKN